MSDTKVVFSDEIKAAIKEVQSDSIATTWCLVTSETPMKAELAGQGEGGPDEMLAMLDPNRVNYGYVRVEDQVDISTTVKFAYVRCVGQKVPFIKKGKFGISAASAADQFRPFHVDFDIEDTGDITAEEIIRKVQETSMSADKTFTAEQAAARNAEFATKEAQREAARDPNRARQHERGMAAGEVEITQKMETTSVSGKGAASGGGGGGAKGPSVNTSNTGLAFAEDLRAAVADVRDNGTATNWVVAEYDNDKVKNVVLKASGSGGYAEMMDNLSADDIYYALLRVVDVIDDHETIKFVYISIIGDRAKVMKKGRISTHKGALNEFFQHYHVSIERGDPADITEDVIQTQVGRASGSANLVR